MSKIQFLNIHVDNVTMSEAIQRVDELVKKRENSYIVTPNLDHIVMIEKDLLFKEIYDNASLVLTDGQPLIWISKFLKKPIKEKVSGSDLFPKLCELAAQKGYSIFILGAAEGVADKAAVNLCKKYPGLNIVGTYSPSLGFEKNSEELKLIYTMIEKANPEILALPLGAPKGEKFIYQSREFINVPVSVQIGATIDFEAGNVSRAPKWMSKCGLEWLYRTLREPKRLAKRYWNDAISVIPIIIKYK